LPKFDRSMNVVASSRTAAKNKVRRKSTRNVVSHAVPLSPVASGRPNRDMWKYAVVYRVRPKKKRKKR